MLFLGPSSGMLLDEIQNPVIRYFRSCIDVAIAKRQKGFIARTVSIHRVNITVTVTVADFIRLSLITVRGTNFSNDRKTIRKARHAIVILIS